MRTAKSLLLVSSGLERFLQQKGLGDFMNGVLGASCLALSLSGCNAHDPKYETVRSSLIDGNFTFQEINYRTPGSYFTAENNFYSRILYKDSVFIKEISGMWHERLYDVGKPAWLLVGYIDSQIDVIAHIMYEEDGKPVIQPLPECRSAQLPRSPKDFMGRCIREDSGRARLELR